MSALRRAGGCNLGSLAPTSLRVSPPVVVLAQAAGDACWIVALVRVLGLTGASVAAATFAGCLAYYALLERFANRVLGWGGFAPVRAYRLRPLAPVWLTGTRLSTAFGWRCLTFLALRWLLFGPNDTREGNVGLILIATGATLAVVLASPGVTPDTEG